MKGRPTGWTATCQVALQDWGIVNDICGSRRRNSQLGLAALKVLVAFSTLLSPAPWGCRQRYKGTPANQHSATRESTSGTVARPVSETDPCSRVLV